MGDKATLMSGSITLGEAAEHTAVLTVGCTRCDRAGKYRLESRVMGKTSAFLRMLSDDCPKRKSITVYDLCGVHCVELPAFFLGKMN